MHLSVISFHILWRLFCANLRYSSFCFATGMASHLFNRKMVSFGSKQTIFSFESLICWMILPICKNWYPTLNSTFNNKNYYRHINNWVFVSIFLRVWEYLCCIVSVIFNGKRPGVHISFKLTFYFYFVNYV